MIRLGVSGSSRPVRCQGLLSAAFFVIGLASTAQAEETFGHQEVDHCGDVDRKGHRASGVIPFVILRRDPPLGTGSARLAGRQATGRLELLQDVPVASVHGPHAARLNLDSGLLCCDWKGYSRTRRVGTRILLKSPDAQGIRYRCRNNDDETSLMFVDRGAVVKIAVRNRWHILADAKGRASTAIFMLRCQIGCGAA